MFNTLELYSEPIEILDHIGAEAMTEMTHWELSFLCGLLKKYKPNKVVEVGIAAGGTTSVVLNCLATVNPSAELFSIDLNKKYYRDGSKKSGFVVDEARQYIQGEIKHSVLLGNVAPAYMEEIGTDIDFLILDTAHVLPGEMLDFIAILPYLSPNAVVVLHDIAYNQFGDMNSEETSFAFATKVLLDTVVAEKILCEDSLRLSSYPNIGAFRVTEDTKKYIENCFSALTITWWYMPAENEIGEYRQSIAKYYKKEYLDLFDKAVLLNRSSLYQKEKYVKKGNIIKMFHEQWNKNKKILFYGPGTIGKIFYSYIKSRNLEIDGFVISDDKNPLEFLDIGIPVYRLSEIPYAKSECCIVLTLGVKYHLEIVQNLYKNELVDVYPRRTAGYDELCDFIFTYVNAEL